MRFAVVVLFSVLLLVSCRKNKELEPFPELRRLFKKLKGEWVLLEHKKYYRHHNPGGHVSHSVNVSGGTMTTITSQTTYSPPNSYTIDDTTVLAYELLIFFEKYTMDHLLKFSTIEIKESSGGEKIIEEKHHTNNWSEAALDNARISGVADGKISFDNENRLTITRSGSYYGVSGGSGSSASWVFVRR